MCSCLQRTMHCHCLRAILTQMNSTEPASIFQRMRRAAMRACRKSNALVIPFEDSLEQAHLCLVRYQIRYRGYLGLRHLVRHLKVRLASFAARHHHG